MLKNTNHGLTEESPLTLLGGRWWRKKEHPNMILSRSLTSHVIDFFLRAFYCQSNLFQDTKLLELFKDDAFSVASEIQRRAEEGCIANPNTSRGRPIYTDSARGRYFYNPCLRKGPQLRTWSSWGPNAEMVLIWSSFYTKGLIFKILSMKQQKTVCYRQKPSRKASCCPCVTWEMR